MIDDLLAAFDIDSQNLLQDYEQGKITLAQWRKRMKELLAQYHLAGMMVGMGTPDITPEGLDIVRQNLNVGQYPYLDNFATVMAASPEFNPAWKSRVRLYSLSPKQSYQEGKVWRTAGKFLPLPAMPAQATICLSNCGCDWRIDKLDGGDNWDCYWVRAKDDSCQTCIQREKDWSPISIRDGILMPATYKHLAGMHDQASHGKRGGVLSHLPADLRDGLSQLAGKDKALADETESLLGSLERKRARKTKENLDKAPDRFKGKISEMIQGEDKELGAKVNMFRQRRGETYNQLRATGMVDKDIRNHPTWKQWDSLFTPLNDEFQMRRQYYDLTRRFVALNEGRKTGKIVIDSEDASRLLTGSNLRDAYIDAGWDGKGKHPYTPSLFRKSDLSGKKVRNYIELPDGRIAHPDEIRDARRRGRIIRVDKMDVPRRTDWSIDRGG